MHEQKDNVNLFYCFKWTNNFKCTFDRLAFCLTSYMITYLIIGEGRKSFCSEMIEVPFGRVHLPSKGSIYQTLLLLTMSSSDTLFIFGYFLVAILHSKWCLWIYTMSLNEFAQIFSLRMCAHIERILKATPSY